MKTPDRSRPEDIWPDDDCLKSGLTDPGHADC